MPVLGEPEQDNLLTGLVSKYSPSHSEYPAVRYLVNEMVEMGFQSFIDSAGNAVGEMGNGDNTLMLLGHIDTVPGDIPVRREGQHLYGRGTVDAKGPLASFVCAAASTGEIQGWRIVVVGAVEEEAATSKGARYLLDKYKPESVIIGEPSSWDRVTIGYKGRLLVDYALEREIGHTAGPGSSVCEDAHAFWHGITEYAAAHNAQHKRVFDQLTPSLRAMHSLDDGFIQKAALTIGFRIPLDYDTDILQHDLLVQAGDATVSFRGREAAYRAAKNTLLARCFIKAIQYEGGQLQFKVKSGTSDMNVVGAVWQCPIVAYGPGNSALDHTPNEHIDLDEYHKAVSVLSKVIIEFCSSG
ncbi:MAG: [LysW]-lysine hydrolase [Anaerolineae bacterium]|nr:[LysW]-lysine hydrolase [Anaerolineae bacterium]